jgi:hypothetical protein
MNCFCRYSCPNTAKSSFTKIPIALYKALLMDLTYVAGLCYVYTPLSPQLLQVCIFAYGQTGSGMQLG